MQQQPEIETLVYFNFKLSFLQLNAIDAFIILDTCSLSLLYVVNLQLEGILKSPKAIDRHSFTIGTRRHWIDWKPQMGYWWDSNQVVSQNSSNIYELINIQMGLKYIGYHSPPLQSYSSNGRMMILGPLFHALFVYVWLRDQMFTSITIQNAPGDDYQPANNNFTHPTMYLTSFAAFVLLSLRHEQEEEEAQRVAMKTFLLLCPPSVEEFPTQCNEKFNYN